MRFKHSIFGKLLAPINRRQLATIVQRHDADAYDKCFSTHDHLLVLIFAQFSAAQSLRGLEAGWNANSQHHYHLASGRLARSTLSDANRRRPVSVFADIFTQLAGELDTRTRREGDEMLRLIDASPIPLGRLCGWVKSNGRIRGMKLHVLYDPKADCPRVIDITDATVNDTQIGCTIQIEPGATYVFDKGYCHYGWWRAIKAAGSVFVTRPKTNMRLDRVRAMPAQPRDGDGFTVLEDDEVHFASKGDSSLPGRLRRLRVRRHRDAKSGGGDTITLLTNDMQRSGVEIAALHKGRWQIELLFRWIKQHLRIRKFLGNNDNAIRLQVFAAMIAYALLRIAARIHSIKTPILRFTDLVAQCLFERREIANIQQPPPVNPAKAKPNIPSGQWGSSYA